MRLLVRRLPWALPVLLYLFLAPALDDALHGRGAGRLAVENAALTGTVLTLCAVLLLVVKPLEVAAAWSTGPLRRRLGGPVLVVLALNAAAAGALAVSGVAGWPSALRLSVWIAVLVQLSLPSCAHLDRFAEALVGNDGPWWCRWSTVQRVGAAAIMYVVLRLAADGALFVPAAAMILPVAILSWPRVGRWYARGRLRRSAWTGMWKRHVLSAVSAALFLFGAVSYLVEVFAQNR